MKTTFRSGVGVPWRLAVVAAVAFVYGGCAPDRGFDYSKYRDLEAVISAAPECDQSAGLCQGGERIADGNQQFVLAQNAKWLQGEQLRPTAMEDGSLVFATTAEESIQVGDVLMGQYADSEAGYLVRISEKTVEADGSIRVVTSEAAVTEAFSELVVLLTVADASQGPLAPPVGMAPKWVPVTEIWEHRQQAISTRTKVVKDLSIGEWGRLFFDFDLGVQGAFSGGVRADLAWIIVGSEIQHFSFQAAARVDNDVVVRPELSLEGEMSFPEVLPREFATLFDFLAVPIGTIPIGPIILTFMLKPEILVDVGGKIDASVEIQYFADAFGSGGVRYDVERTPPLEFLKPESQLILDFEKPNWRIEGEGFLKTTLLANLLVNISGFVTPGLGLGPYGKGVAAFDFSNTKSDCALAVLAGLDFKASVQSKFRRLNASKRFEFVEIPLWERDNLCDSVVPLQSTVESGPQGIVAETTAELIFASNEPLVEHRCKLDGGLWAECTSPWQYTGLAAGTHTFQVYAIADDGRIESVPARRTWRIDNLAPQVTLSSGPNAVISADNPEIDFFCSESNCLFECNLDNGGWSFCLPPNRVDASAEGDHSLSVRSIDFVGNISEAKTWEWERDSSSPVVSISAGAHSGKVNETSASIFFSCPPAAECTYTCSWNGAPAVPCSSPASKNDFQEGAASFDVAAIARNGFPSSDAANWTVDLTPPNSSINSPSPSGTDSDQTPTFYFSANEDSTFECKIDTGSWDGCTSPHTTQSLSSGSHTFNVRATDFPAGNLEPTPATRTWTIDPGPQCNNGVQESGEDCDQSDLDGETCQSLGFHSGNLTCKSSCSFDTSNCITEKICSATEDTMVRSSSANSFGNFPTMNFGKTPAGDEDWAFVEFPNSCFPSGADVQEAELHVYMAAGNGSVSVDVALMSSNWNESTAYGDFSSGIVTLSNPHVSMTWLSGFAGDVVPISVPNLVQEWADGTSNRGFTFRWTPGSTANNNWVSLATSEAATSSNRPKLIVRYK